MFLLNKVDNECEKFILLPVKNEYTVGRLSTDLILSEDLSISRTHVSFCLSNNVLTVEDLGSRYGTFINNGITQNKKMQAKTPTPLDVGNKLRFGALKNIWKVSQLKLNTTGSALTRTELLELSQLIKPLGGIVLPSWTDDCTHLTMDTVTITAKLLHALLENKPIVRIDFWREMLKVAKRIHVTEDWPQPKDFAPVQPSDMPSIKWRPERTKLFAGITFVFMNRKHIEMYGQVVQKAGGLCKDLNAGVRKPFLTKKNVIVIQYLSSTQSQGTETIHSVQGILEQAGLRLIPDYEIGLAILHCSMEKFCNPAHTVIENSMTTTESMNSSILVPNTERTQTERCRKNYGTEFVVPESFAKSQTSQVYAPSLGSDKPSLESQSETSSQSSTKTRQGKRSNPVYLDDSSDDDVAVVEQPSKKLKTVIESKPKRISPILLESSDEEPIVRQSKRKNSINLDSSSDEEQPQEKKSKQNAIHELALNAADQSALEDLANSEALSIEKEVVDSPPTVSSRCSTRSKPQPQLEKEESISPRRSLRGKPTADKAKLTDIQHDKGDSSEDEDLFQFKPQSLEPVAATRAPFKPTEINIESNEKPAENTMIRSQGTRPPRISVRNFLEKSQHNAATQKVDPVASQPRKRVALKVLNESDSDDLENVFQFGDSKKPRKTLDAAGSDDDSNDQGLFNFKDHTQQDKEMQSGDDSVSIEPLNAETRKKSKYIVPKPKELRKIDTSGWLSCSGLHEDVKPEPKPELDAINMDASPSKKEFKNKPTDNDDDDDKFDHEQWLASIKNSIQVRMCNMNISGRSLDQTDAVNTTASKYSGRKNFKKFVKNNNAHPQQQILALKRMQLAEGVVVSL